MDMGIREWFSKKVERKDLGNMQATFRSIILDMGDGTSIPDSYHGRTREGYEQNSYVFKCINARAKSVSLVDSMVLDLKGQEHGDNHPLVKLLHRPNPGQSQTEFISMIEFHLALMGNAYILPVHTKVKGLTQLHIIRPDYVTYTPSGNIFDPVQSWTIGGTGTGMIQLDPQDLIHIRALPGTDPVYGSSPLAAAGMAVAQQNAAKAWNNAMLSNSGKPSIAVLTPAELTQEQFRQAQARLESGFAGKRNAGKTMVLDAGKTVQPIGFSPTDMDWRSGMTISAKEIAIAFEVPPEKIGDSANKTYSNMQEANREFASGFVRPELDLIWSVISRYCVPFYDDVSEVTFDAAMIPGIKADETNLMNSLSGNYFLTINEKRAALGYGPVTGGDVLMQPMGLISLAEAQALPPEIGQPPEEEDEAP
jgi:HK97 family phage portal protein